MYHWYFQVSDTTVAKRCENRGYKLEGFGLYLSIAPIYQSHVSRTVNMGVAIMHLLMRGLSQIGVSRESSE